MTGIGIWVGVSLALPMIGTLIDGPPKDGEQARNRIALCFLWPVLGPLLLAGLAVAGPFVLLGKYADWLVQAPEEEAAPTPVEGKVVE